MAQVALFIKNIPYVYNLRRFLDEASDSKFDDIKKAEMIDT